MVIIYILKMPGVQAMKAAEILEWFFYATLPNYCFSGGIQTLYENFMNLDLCDTNDMKLMCDALKGTEITNLCCPGTSRHFTSIAQVVIVATVVVGGRGGGCDRVGGGIQ